MYKILHNIIYIPFLIFMGIHVMAKAGKRWRKAEKGLDKDDSLYIFKTTGVFVAVGSGKFSYSS